MRPSLELLATPPSNHSPSAVKARADVACSPTRPVAGAEAASLFDADEALQSDPSTPAPEHRLRPAPNELPHPQRTSAPYRITTQQTEPLGFACRLGAAVLNPLRAAHATWVHEQLFANPQVMRWYRDGRGRSFEQTFAMLEAREKAWGEGRLAGWLVCVEGAPAGYFGCGSIERREMEVGYAFAPEFWGKGLATDTLFAALNYFKDLAPEFDAVVATAHPDNAGSNRVLLKAGFVWQRVGQREDYADAARNYYRLDTSCWPSHTIAVQSRAA